jgi:hypothetical protein
MVYEQLRLAVEHFLVLFPIPCNISLWTLVNEQTRTRLKIKKSDEEALVGITG